MQVQPVRHMTASGNTLRGSRAVPGLEVFDESELNTWQGEEGQGQFVA